MPLKAHTLGPVCPGMTRTRCVTLGRWLSLSGQQGLHLEMGMSLGPLSMRICKTRQKVSAWRTLSVAGKRFLGCCVALSNPVLSRSFGFPFHTSSWDNSLDGARWPETRNKAAPAPHKAWQEGRGHTRQPPLVLDQQGSFLAGRMEPESRLSRGIWGGVRGLGRGIRQGSHHTDRPRWL